MTTRKAAMLLVNLLFIASFTTSWLWAQNERSVNNKTGVLILAHGGKDSWNAEVMKVAAEVGKSFPVEVAFGMASKRTIQPAVDSLVESGVQEIIAVPLFVSSHSSVITSTEFLLGLRAEAPAALAIFAKMDHGGHGGHSGQADHASGSFDPLTPVKVSVPIKMVNALNAHPIVGDILLSRAKALSKDQKNEVVVIVAHGPVSEETNKLWLKDMANLADIVRAGTNFKRIEYMTVRDDAPEPIREQAAKGLRELVKRASDEKSSTLVVPLLISHGGIENGIKERLKGLEYKMSSRLLLPDKRIAEWVLRSVEASKK